MTNIAETKLEFITELAATMATTMSRFDEFNLDAFTTLTVGIPYSGLYTTLMNEAADFIDASPSLVAYFLTLRDSQPVPVDE